MQADHQGKAGEAQGYLCLILHAHLPYVRHPEYEDFLEEDWFFEAITETYVPLIDVLAGLLRDGVSCKLTMSLTPPLAAMLADELLQERYLRHIEKLIELSAKEVERTQWMPAFHVPAQRYHELFLHARDVFAERYGRNLVTAFRSFQDAGILEVITCGSTHGFLPLMVGQRSVLRGQIQTAVRDYERHFGRRPRGIWLPECGYEPGLEQILKEADLHFFILDAHGVLHASPRPRYGVFAPIITRAGVAAFGRDLESSKQVWSAHEGYPGDYDYREFYRDVGWDLEYDYIRPYLHGDGQRTNLGIKYYRITGPGDHREPYDFDRAREKAAVHAGNFMFNRERQIEHLYSVMGRPPIVVAPYDAELFGHWWYEGPQWLDALLRKSAYDQKIFATITPSEYLKLFPVNQVATPSFSSWGYKGYAEVWLEGSNDWIYRHLHKVGERMVELANRFRNLYGEQAESLRAAGARVNPGCGRPGATGGPGNNAALEWRALTQAGRELLLAQSSDWAFIMKTGTMVDYAVRRTREHVMNFNKIYRDVLAGTIDRWWLEAIERKDNIFPDFDPLVYADPGS